MTNVITLRVPKSLYERVKLLAKDDGISLNQYVQMALTEKLSREETMEMIEGRFVKLQNKLVMADLARTTEFKKKFDEVVRRADHRYHLIERELQFHTRR